MAGNPARSAQLSHTTQNLLKSYKSRLQDDIRTMYENFNEIIRSAKITTDEKQLVQKESQGYFDVYQMKVRAANIVRAGESLLKLISDLKTFVILNDFPSINEQLNQQNQALKNTGDLLQQKIIEMRDEFSSAMIDLENEYYNSLRIPVRKPTNHSSSMQ
uniref:mediator of RNA polymerase II transcription subunit 22-like n=1 Tax=Styela clava TaxID=7725 RepID=UPI00193964B7|nr:mediator of RNA polymerase II transcription subunit 22-like [Styela clava]